MVVVRCLMLCSKFARNCLSAGLRPDHWGSLQRSPTSSSWITGEGRGKGRWKGRRGRLGEVKEGGGSLRSWYSSPAFSSQYHSHLNCSLQTWLLQFTVPQSPKFSDKSYSINRQFSCSCCCQSLALPAFSHTTLILKSLHWWPNQQCHSRLE